MLVVTRVGEVGELLIPFHASYVLEVDLTAGRVAVDWPEEV